MMELLFIAVGRFGEVGWGLRLEVVESCVVWGKLSFHVYQISKWRCQVGYWIYESAAQVEV